MISRSFSARLVIKSLKPSNIASSSSGDIKPFNWCPVCKKKHTSENRKPSAATHLRSDVQSQCIEWLQGLCGGHGKRSAPHSRSPLHRQTSHRSHRLHLLSIFSFCRLKICSFRLIFLAGLAAAPPLVRRERGTLRPSVPSSLPTWPFSNEILFLLFFSPLLELFCLLPIEQRDEVLSKQQSV
jgi:hypothetical protein